MKDLWNNPSDGHDGAKLHRTITALPRQLRCEDQVRHQFLRVLRKTCERRSSEPLRTNEYSVALARNKLGKETK